MTAFGLAANIVSFLEFATKIIHATQEIRNSESGCSADVTSLDTLYGHLQLLSDGLTQGTDQRGAVLDFEVTGSKETDHSLLSLKHLAEDCKADCDRLLKVTEKLKTGSHSTSRWSSFVIALRKVWEKKQIEELEERLKKLQITMNLHVCTVVAYVFRARPCSLTPIAHKQDQIQVFPGETFL